MIYKVFISSVQKELKTEREAAENLIKNDPLFSDYFTPYLFEGRKGAKSHSAMEEYLGNAGECDIYIGIIGNEYGKKGKDNKSPVEREYDKAKKKCVYILIKGNNDEEREKETRNFLNKIKDEKRGHCYKRFETIAEMQDIIRHSLVDFLKKQHDIFKGNFEDRPVKGANIKEISDEKIRWFIKTANAHKRLRMAENTKPAEVLKRFELLHDGTPTIAAILLFGNNPQKYFRISEVNCAHYPGIINVKPMLSQHIYEGTLFDQIDKAVEFVLGSIDRAVIAKPGRADFDRPFEIPEFVVEEAIINAVVHRNYGSLGSVQLGLFADRLDIWNPGPFVKGLDAEKLKQIHSSTPRNPKIAEIMFRAGYIQKQGTGIADMIDKCREKGLPEPEFKDDGHVILTTIRRDVLTEIALIKKGLNERQIKAVNYIKTAGKISNNEYLVLNKTSKATATRDLADLVKKKILMVRGTGKRDTGYWLK